MSEIVKEPPVKARPSVDTDILFAIHPELLNDSYVYVHCHVRHAAMEMLVRIWRTTFLIDRQSSARSGLVHAENITFAPVWTIVPQNFNYTFLLIFNGLPKSCEVFDFVEEIEQSGGFYVPDIVRNESDVYHIDLSL
jgi:hypothetical protein